MPVRGSTCRSSWQRRPFCATFKTTESFPLDLSDARPMAHINAQIPALEASYGRPAVRRIDWDAEPYEFDLLTAAVERNRFHDVTLFIRRGDRVAVVRKPTYPPGVFRPPSGGVEPGESFEAGALREAYEETGLRVALRRYLLRVESCFHLRGESDETIRWVSHVFLADWCHGEPRPIDRKEIAEARWATRDELETDLQRRLDDAPTAGLRYRGWLQREACELWRRLEAGDDPARF